jgi:hypothetical protein
MGVREPARASGRTGNPVSLATTNTNPQSMYDHTTTAVASAAVSSPLWLPSLKDVSDTAALLLPILGAAWLVVQIVGYVVRYRKNHK